jgi:3-hydroxymyristoyl/3-hydroxydecanoyl-(acyl carrier protein) dehydratase
MNSPVTPLPIAADHPAFDGHFPGQPIVPGVVLLDLAQRAIEAETGCTLVALAAAKFHHPAGPGEALALQYEQRQNAVSFEIRSATQLVASGRFLRQAAAQP